LEHLSAAAAILGVPGWVLEAQHADLPLFDGSARVWAKWMEKLVRETLACHHLELSPVSWRGRHRGHLEAQAASEFHLEVEWSAGPFGPERWEGGFSDLPGILGARTFIEAGDWWMARRRGLLHGIDPGSGRLLAGPIALPEIALEELRREGIEPRGRVWTGGDERIPDECAAHKALDLVGDIACAIGYLPALRIVARDAGHTLHAKLGQALRHAHEDT
jgi:UDP-3-O-[3-hydroxymyristoyl] N-acetylglucosamine deacetylase